ncbi:hypothetical protein [Terricaulis sp.]|uniref:hypothetical protein n=1 Tax=Terricaulis sp. TaxID=2768686 RepID=UPI0037846481
MSNEAPDVPDFSGTWKLVPKESKLPGMPVKQMIVQITHKDPDFAQVSKVEYIDGRTAVRTFMGRTDGEKFANASADVMVVSVAKWVGKELLIETTIDPKSGEAPLRDYWSLTDGGRKLRMEHRDDALNGFVGVLERMQDGK